MSRISAAADGLIAAYSSGIPVDPLTEIHPDLTIDDAYAIQMEQVARWVRDGAVIEGHKTGLTSAAMRRMLGVNEPDYGHLTGDMFFPEFSPIPMARFIQPRIEPEIAFVLGKDLQGPGVTIAKAAHAVDFVLPALEVIDSRIRDWKIGLLDTIADNASSGGVVLGSRPALLASADLSLVGCNLVRNAQLAATGAGAAVLGNPLLALAWLTNVLGERGVGLKAGHVVLSGSCTTAIPVQACDTVSATFAGLGSVTAVFEEKVEA